MEKAAAGQILEKIRLERFYYAFEISGLLVPIVLIAIVKIFSAEVIFSGSTRSFLILLLCVLVTHALLFLLREVTKNKTFLYINRYLWLFYWLVSVYLSGGARSQLIYFLAFPLLISAVDLEERETKRVGIILTVGLALTIFAEPVASITGALLVKHAVSTVIFAIIAYFVHSLVKETLRQKYERGIAERRLAEMAELNRVKDDFVKIAEHQLRTPLSGVRWALESVLQGGPREERESELLKSASEKVDSAIGILGGMLKTAEIDMAGMKIAGEPIDISAMAKAVTDELAYMVDKNKVSLGLEVEPGLMISGNADMLRGALTNVIDNAVRYSPGGAVTVKVADSGNDVEVAVKDNGIGISKEDMPFVFEKFHRSKEAMAIDPNETGVGLYVTKRVVDLHSGSISVASDGSKGTEVRIRFPRSAGSGPRK